jgi:hypothetical protein
MNTIKDCLILTLILIAITLAGCSASSNVSNSQANTNSQPAANSNVAKTNVEELGMLINVPYESDEVFWKDDAAHKKLVAVLRFPPGEANRLIADAEKVRPPQAVTISSESWFPAELVAQSEMSGDDQLNGRAYAADSFFQEPYNQGRVIRVEDTDYFVLELSAK